MFLAEEGQEKPVSPFEKREKKMAYNRENLLRKIIEIQDIVLEHKGRGVTQIWVYENIIKDRYHISVATFNNFLATPAKAELKQLLDKRKADERQNPKLF
jgi:hypothetical protein